MKWRNRIAEATADARWIEWTGCGVVETEGGPEALAGLVAADELYRRYDSAGDALAKLWSHAAELHLLRSDVTSILTRLESLEQKQAFQVTIQKLPCDELVLKRDIEVVVNGADGSFVASFFDANISASGVTEAEAVANLREMIVEVYDLLSAHEKSALGPGPRSQWDTLQYFVETISDGTNQ